MCLENKNLKNKIKIFSLVAILLSIFSFLIFVFINSNKQKTELRFELVNNLGTLDPAYCGNEISIYILNHIYEPLFDFIYVDQQRKLVPILAETIPRISNNNKTYEIRLKKGVYFSNNPCFSNSNREMVAADFVYSVKRNLLLPDSVNFSYALKIKGAEEFRKDFLSNLNQFIDNFKTEGIYYNGNYLEIELNNEKENFNKFAIDNFLNELPIYAKECVESVSTNAKTALSSFTLLNNRLKMKLNELGRFPSNKCFKKEDNVQGFGRKINIKDVIYSIKKLAVTQDEKKLVLVRKFIGLSKIKNEFDALFNRYIEKSIEGLKSDGRYKIIIELKNPDPYFYYFTSTIDFYVYPKEAVDYFKDNFANNPIGTGPFVLKKEENNEEYFLTKNKSFRTDSELKLPSIDIVKINIESDSRKIEKNFLNAQTDFIIPHYIDSSDEIYNDLYSIFVDRKPSKIYSYTDGIKVKYFRFQDPTVFSISFNMNDKFIGDNFIKETKSFKNIYYTVKKGRRYKKINKKIEEMQLINTSNNKYLRQALTVALDSEHFVRTFFSDRVSKGIEAQWIIPPIIGPVDDEYRNPFKIKRSFEEKQKLIADLLYRSGYDINNLPVLEIDANKNSELKANQFIKFAQKYGIKINAIIHSNNNSFAYKLSLGAVQIFMLNFSTLVPLPDPFIELLYSKKNDPITRYTSYNNPEYDNVYEQYLITRDNNLIKKLRDIAVEDSVMIPLAFHVSHVFIHDYIEQMDINPFRPFQFKTMKINMAKKERLIRRIELAKKGEYHWYNKVWDSYLDFVDYIINAIRDNKTIKNIFNKPKEDDPAKFEDLINTARKKESIGNYEEAVLQYHQALLIQPDDMELKLHSVSLDLLLNRLKSAESILDELFYKNPERADINNYLGMLKYQQGQLDAAIAYMQQAIKQDPNDAYYLYNLGKMYFEKGNYTVALEYFDNANKHNTKMYEALLYQGLTLFKLGRYLDATTKLDMAREINPYIIDSYIYGAYCYFKINKTDIAYKLLDKIIYLDPLFQNKLLENFELLKVKLNRDEEIKLINDMKDQIIVKNDKMSIKKLALLHYLKGNKVYAYSLLNSQKETEYRVYEVLFKYLDNNVQEALKLVESITNVQIGLEVLQYLHGKLLLENGQTVQALPYLKNALNSFELIGFTNHPDIVLLLCKSYKNIKDEAGSTKFCDLASRLIPQYVPMLQLLNAQ